MKLHLGCGNHYLAGWVNLDFIKGLKLDVMHDLNKFPYPFKKNQFNYILADNVIEHLGDTIKVMEELHRISKNKGIIEIIVPLAPTMYAFLDPTHKVFFTHRSFDVFTKGYSLDFYSKARYKILERKIIFHHKLRFLNPLINMSKFFQRFMCEFFSQFFPPALISFKLEVVK